MMTTEAITMRTCSTCERDHPATREFFSRSGRGGLSRRCKGCDKAYRDARTVREVAPEGATRACSKCEVELPATRENFNPSKLGKWGLDSWCRPCRNADSLERNTARYYADPAYRRKTILAATERQERLRPWEKPENLPRYAAAQRRRKARLRECYGDHTAEDVLAIYERQRGMCGYCFEPVAFGKMHVDHYMPLAAGGRNDSWNLVVACPRCNCSKGAKMPVDFSLSRASGALMEV